MCTAYTSCRLLSSSGFGNAVGSVEDAAINDIQEITFLRGCLMCKGAAVCGSRIWLEFFVSVWYDLWKSRERESTMMFYVPSMCCEYRDFLLLTSVHTSQHTAESCDSAFTGSKDALCIQLIALVLSVNANMCNPSPIFC